MAPKAKRSPTATPEAEPAPGRKPTSRRAPRRTTPPAEATAPPAEAASAPAVTAHTPTPPSFERLDGATLRVLRAAAVIGSPFSAEAVAGLLRTSPLEVLEALQRAADAGVPLSDGGEGVLRLEDHVQTALLRTLLPSLLEAWCSQAAAEARAPAPSTAAATPAEPVEPVAPVAPVAPTSGAAAATAPEPQVRPVAPSPADLPTPQDDARRLLEAARSMLQLGDDGSAWQLVERAWQQVGQLEDGSARGLLAAEVLLERGRLRARFAGRGNGLDLDAALEDLDAAERLAQAAQTLTPAARSIRAEIAAAAGEVCLAIGDRPHLDRALDRFTDAAKLHEEAGDALAATRLLNDQAAVWVQLGDPVRAHWLLEQSRRVFASRAASDESARREVAETDLLIATLPLHVAARPGLERQAIERAVTAARGAAETFLALGDARASARALRILAQLMARNGALDEALAQLEEASAAAAAVHDVVGLGEAAATRAALLSSANRVPAALDALAIAARHFASAGAWQGLHDVADHLAADRAAWARAGLARSAAALHAEIEQALGRAAAATTPAPGGVGRGRPMPRRPEPRRWR